MPEISFYNIVTVVLSGLGLAFVMGAVGMALWYIKVKPDVEMIKNDLAKKAAAAEVVRISLDLERKREDDHRVHAGLLEKRNISECDLIRAGCQPLLLSKLEEVGVRLEKLTAEQSKISDKLENWMMKNGGT